MFDLGEVNLESLIAAVDRSGLTEVTITTADGELRISKAAPTASAATPVDPAPAAAVPVAPTGTASSGTSSPEPAEPAVPVAAAVAVAGAVDGPPPGHAHVRTPLLGVFYRAPEPGAPPFVEVGDHVEADQTVAIVEAMKVFTAVPAGVRGVVREILVADRDFVEFDQPILVVELEADAG